MISALPCLKSNAIGSSPAGDRSQDRTAQPVRRAIQLIVGQRLIQSFQGEARAMERHLLFEAAGERLRRPRDTAGQILRRSFSLWFGQPSSHER